MFSWLRNSDSFEFIRNALDIFVVALIIYYLLKMIKGTRAVYMLVGLSFGVMIYWISSFGELYTLNWILYHFLGNFLLIIVVLFQNDIRRALTRFGRAPMFSFLGTVSDRIVIDELIRTSVSLANKKIGSLIVVEKDANVLDYVELGVAVDGVVSKQLLTSIFLPSSPLHDGAVLIQKGKVSYASCFLPLSMSSDLDQELGTRHRAAIGLTEETDAIVIVVSEEKGWVSVAIGGKIIRGVDAAALRKILSEQFQNKVTSWFGNKIQSTTKDPIGKVDV